MIIAKILMLAGIVSGSIGKGTGPKRYRKPKGIMKAIEDLRLFFMAVIVKYPIVALDIPKAWNDREDYVMLVYNGLNDNVNGWYTPAPTAPTLLIFKGHIDAFLLAQANVDAKKDDAVNIRDAAWNLVLADLRALRFYVQVICSNNIDHAEEIAAECNMYIVIRMGREKQRFAAKAAGDGQVELSGVVRAQRQATEWEVSTDPADPVKWNELRIPPTLAANTLVSGLQSNRLYYFRSRVILMEGPQPWSEVINVMTM